MRLRIRITPRVSETDEIAVSRVERLDPDYTIATAAMEIDKAIENRRPLRLVLEGGKYLELQNPQDYASIAIADSDVTGEEDDV